MAKAKVRPWVKYSALGLIAALLVGGLWYLGNSGKVESPTGGLFGGSHGKTIVVGTNTYAGFLPWIYLNGGLEGTPESILQKEYGISLKIVIQDDFQAGRGAFRNGDIDILYCTADAFPVEMSEGSDMADARFFNISNWSRGADAIVVSKGIKKVSDLLGKTVACSEGTASHTLLLNTLETSGISWDKVNTSSRVDPKKVNIKVVSSGLDAAAVFQAYQVDAAVVFSPDDQAIIKSVPGAHILVSTKQASGIICDGLIAKEEFLEKNQGDVKKLISALLWANSEMNTNPKALKEAAGLFAKAYGVDEEFALEGAKNIYFVTLQDEANFFGLSSDWGGIKGEELYSKMARTYSGLGLTKSPMPWRKVSYEGIIEALLEKPSEVKGSQEAEKKVTFEAPKEKEETVEAISTKKISIEFPLNGDVLDNDGIMMINREFIGIAKEFSGARIRITGNTDNTGNPDYNKDLSWRRAKAAADYLVKTCGFDENRFIVVGQGSKNAIEAGSVGADQRYRTTDFELITEP